MPVHAEHSLGGVAQGGAVSLAQAAAWIDILLARVAECHENGRAHGALCVEAIRFDDAGLPRIAPPDGGVVRLDACPLPPEEFRRSGLETLPASLEAARSMLRDLGISCVPEQIDLAAAGDILCRWITGVGAAAYLRSPRVKGAAPPEWQGVIARLLGCDGEPRFDSAAAARAAVASIAPLRAAGGAEGPAGAIGDTESDTTPSFAAAERSGNTSVVGGTEMTAGSQASLNSDIPRSLGHYQIVGRLGQGGMGDVYKGYEPQLDRHVAIKVLPAELARHDEFVRRFRAEATAAARLVHPNVVQVFFIGEDQGRHFFAMQYVEGESLSDLLARRKRLDPDETTSLIEQCLHGLGAAHELGMIHRDIKPGNILIDRVRRRALLADFGLVKALDTAAEGRTTTGVVMGTADYIPPEQGRGQAVDARSDLYSIGVMLYRMLSGRLPFDADSPTAMIFQHVYEPPPPLRQVCPDVPEQLARIVNRLLAKSPDERYQSAAEILEALRPSQRRALVSAHGAERSSTRKSTIIVPASPDLPCLPAESVAFLSDEPAGWLDRLWRGAAGAARKVAPELVQQLQSTGQQVDDAVRLHAERLEQLERLSREAESVLGELRRQDGSRAGGSSSGPLAELVREQESQVQELHSRRDQARVALQTLRSQRDALRARLKAAQAQLVVAGGRVESSGGRWGRLMRQPRVVAAAAAALLIVAVAMMSRPGPPQRETSSENTPPVVSPGLPFPAVAPKLPKIGGNPPPAAVAPFDAAQAKKHQQEWAAYLNVPVEYTNSIGMRFVLIPPGEYLRGTSDADIERAVQEQPGIPRNTFDIEKPQHKVRITRPFYLGRFEVTVGDFRAFTSAAGFRTDAEKGRANWGYDAATGEISQRAEYSWKNPGFAQTDEHPAPNVSWDDSVAFNEWLSRKEGRTYRFPTEAEWEYACRAGTTTLFHTGDTNASLEGFANLADQSWKRTKGAPPDSIYAPFDDGFAFTAPVGRFKPNAFGLHDMHGNVWEWCRDGYEPNHYATLAGQVAVDPYLPEARRRVDRGGSWVDEPAGQRSAKRSWTSNHDQGANSCGFRALLEIPAVDSEAFTTLSRQKLPPDARIANASGATGADPPTGLSVSEALRKAEHLLRTEGINSDKFDETLRAVADRLPVLEPASAPRRPHWNRVTLNADGQNFDAFRFRSPLSELADMHWVFVKTGLIKSWYILPVRGRMEGFQKYRAEHSSSFLGNEFPEGIVYLQNLRGQILPGQDYILWFRSMGTEPIDFRATIHLFKQGTLPQRFSTRGQLRDLGIDVPAGSAAPGSRVIEAHLDEVSFVRFLPDGQTLISAGTDGAVRLWNAADAKETASWNVGHDVRKAALSPDGKTLAVSGYFDTRIVLWDIAGRNAIREFSPRTGQVSSMAFSPDGSSLAAHYLREPIRVEAPAEAVQWSIAEAKAMWSISTPGVWLTGLRFEPDGKSVLGAGGRLKGGPGEIAKEALLVSLDAASGRMATLSSEQDAWYRCLSAPLDSASIIVGGVDGHARSLRRESGDRTILANLESSVACVRPVNEKVVALGCDDGTVHLWNHERKVVQRILRGHSKAVTEVDVAPDGRLVSCGVDGTVRIWDKPESQP